MAKHGIRLSDREGDLHRLADDGGLGRYRAGERVRRVIGEDGKEARVVDVGQIGLQAVARDGREIAGRRIARLDACRIDIDVELYRRVAVGLDDKPAILQPLEPAHLMIGQRLDLARDDALMQLVEGVGHGDWEA